MTYLNPVIHPLTPSADLYWAVQTGLFQPVKTIRATFGWDHLPSNPGLAADLKEIQKMKWRGEL